MVYDDLIERAFATKESPTGTPSPTLHPRDLDPSSSELPTEPAPTEETVLNPVWEEVREQKAKLLAKLPSKVESLEGLTVEAPSLSGEELRPRLKRKNR